MNEKNNGVLITLVIVLAVALCGTSGYIVYDKFFANDIEVEVVKDKDNGNKEDKIDVKALGETLYKKAVYPISIIDLGNTNTGDVKKEYTINYDSINNKDRLSLAISMINENNFEYSSDWKTLEECLPDSENDGDWTYKCESSRVQKKYFEEAYYNRFGNDKKIDYEKFRGNGYEVCNLENDYIVCYPFDGGDMSGTFEFLNYDKAEQSNNDVIVYVDYLRYEAYDGIYAILYGKTKRIDSYEYIESLENKYRGERNDNYKEELFNHYKGKTGKFKVTFKQDKTGNYYWNNSEFISE